MALSSLSVVASSLALHLYRPPNVALTARSNSKANGAVDYDAELVLQAPLLDQKLSNMEEGKSA